MSQHSEKEENQPLALVRAIKNLANHHVFIGIGYSSGQPAGKEEILSYIKIHVVSADR